MKREFREKLLYLLNEWIPPAIRDSDVISIVLTRISYGKHHSLGRSFHKNKGQLTASKIDTIYTNLGQESSTYPDYKSETANWLIKNIKGKTVVDVGCGNGELIHQIQKAHNTTAIALDKYPDHRLHQKYPQVVIIQGSIEQLPFATKSIDTVISVHVVEHLKDFDQAIAELRRIAKKRLIIVVPKEREYKYVTGLHYHFFPYEDSLLLRLKPKNKYICFSIGDEIIYLEYCDYNTSLKNYLSYHHQKPQKRNPRHRIDARSKV